MKKPILKPSMRVFGLLILLTVIAFGCNKEKYSLGDLRASIVTPTSKFTIDPDADTTLFGEEGTRIFLEKQTFQFADGTPVTGPIEVEVQEFYDKSDIVVADLATASDGKMLVTGGMLNITASSQGKEVEIRGDKRMVVHFPKPNGNQSEKMDLFYVDNSATESAVTNWDVDTVNLVKKTLQIRSWGWWRPSDDDSTQYDFVPKNRPKDEYFINPLDFYLNSYDFASTTRSEIESNLNRNDYPDFDLGIATVSNVKWKSRRRVGFGTLRSTPGSLQPPAKMSLPF